MNGWNLVPGYKNIGTKEDVCGGEPTIVGTRLEPIFIASYGPDAIEDFEITQEQYDEAVKWIVQEIKRLEQERDKLIEGLREIDTHIRSTPEPVQYIVGTLKRVLPEYREGVTVE